MAVKLAGDTLRKSTAYLNKLADRTAEKISKSIARRAEENYSSAVYDGPQTHIDHIRVQASKTSNGRWSVTASGYAVQFVEFGTGTVGDGTYKGNLPRSYSYDAKMAGVPSHIPGNKGWYFSTDQPLASDLKHAYRYIRGRDEDGELLEMPERLYKMQATSGRVGYVKESLVGISKARGAKVLAKESDARFFARRKKEALESGALVQEETKNSYYTKGNPANNCLYDAVEYARENLSGIVKVKK